MENDLISRKKMLNALCGTCENKMCVSEFDKRDCLTRKLINEQPIAYDTDKVVEQIREYFGTFLNKSIIDDICNIVKAGGMNE